MFVFDQVVFNVGEGLVFVWFDVFGVDDDGWLVVDQDFYFVFDVVYVVVGYV